MSVLWSALTATLHVAAAVTPCSRPRKVCEPPRCARVDAPPPPTSPMWLACSQPESSCFMRQCCGAQREFNLDIYMRDRMNPEEGRGPILSHAFRPFKCCEFVCFNRPEMFVKNASNQHIGHVFNPFTCCSWDVDVSGPAEHRYDNGEVDPEAAKAIAGTPWKLSATCCQLGIYCRCPCDPCKRVIFEIKDSEDNVVGELQCVARQWRVVAVAVRIAACDVIALPGMSSPAVART